MMFNSTQTSAEKSELPYHTRKNQQKGLNRRKSISVKHNKHQIKEVPGYDDAIMIN